jgi:hypothetical protein
MQMQAESGKERMMFSRIGYAWFVAKFVKGTLLSNDRAEPRPAAFGKAWVRSHPFTLMALTQRGEAVSDNDLYAKAGLNTMLAWKDRSLTFQAAARQRIPWQFHLDMRRGPLSDELKSYVNGLLNNYPGGEGLLLWDEPKLNEMADLAKVAAWLREAHPELLVYTNLNPIPSVGDPRFAGYRAGPQHADDESYPYSYDDSIRDCIAIVQPDVLMTDIYPFWSPKSLDPRDYLQTKYFLNLSLIRAAALDNEIPYWMFVQAYQDEGRVRAPSESDLRMQVFSTLAYGFTGIAYYTYDVVEEGSMLDAQMRPTPIYEHVTKLNAEVKQLGKALRFLTSVDVRYVPGRPGNPVPLGLEAYRPNSWASTLITNIAVGSEDKNALIGFFEDDAGGLYFMVVNLAHGESISAGQAATPITLSLARPVKSLYVLSRDTGKPVAVNLDNDNQAKLAFPGGTGELFKIGDAKFAGLAD